MTKRLEDTISEEERRLAKKESNVDRVSLMTYALAVGSILDYATGLRGWQIATSRAYQTGVNAATGGWYGKWRNFVFNKTRTTDEHSRLRRGFVDLLAFNSLNQPMYASGVALASLIFEGHVDIEKIENGARNLAMLSPFMAPTLGLYSDTMRKLFGIPSAPEKARQNQAGTPSTQ